MHPSFSVLTSKGFGRVSSGGRKLTPFSTFSEEGVTYAVDSLGQLWAKAGRGDPGPEFEEVSGVTAFPLAPSHAA